ncbi:MAG TPA: ATP-binding protein [Candidatus Hydrogenedentes bacterium]|nr:ATP-binding protein [Candidatus Hydrogenedentota bacterium]HPG68851.1 ATP-binding protein [Candidatus Hydrogenedentota bacterium]
MRIAIASGKGGTGKTTVATNLAYLASRDGRTAAYLDCDVEEPNGALFLKPVITKTHPVNVSVPKIDVTQCTGCGLCGQICQYSAIVPMKNKVLVFPELCHGCGGCWLVCKAGAITESYRTTGRIEQGHAGQVQFTQGILDVGQAMSPPVIRAVKETAAKADLVIIDAPPGTSCPVIESVRDSDYVLLVTEPTPFGLNDLKLAVEMVRALDLPFAVVINRAERPGTETHTWCEQESIRILAEIPDDRRVAEAYSRGEMIGEALTEYAETFSNMLADVEALLGDIPSTVDGGLRP